MTATAGRLGRMTRWAAQGLVLAVVTAGTTVYLAEQHTVTLEMDGEVRTITAKGHTVQDVLSGHDISLGADQQVFPSLTSGVTDGDVIIVRTVRSIEVEIDGDLQTIVTSASTVGEVLAEIGPRTDGAKVSASRTEVLGRGPLTISTLKDVTLAIDGRQIPLSSAESTVRDLLLVAGVVLAEGDTVSADLASTVQAGQVITVSRAASDTSTVTEVLPFATEEIEDPGLIAGKRIVKRAGVLGQAVTTYDVTLLDGVEASREVVAQQVTVPAVAEIVRVGTLELPDPSQIVVDPGSARAIAQSMVSEKGWDETEFACLDSLWQKESKWNVTAANRSSGAYGIPQALPGSKMASVGDDWQSNAATQITWGLGYIEGRYGTPCSAWGHSKSSGWY